MSENSLNDLLKQLSDEEKATSIDIQEPKFGSVVIGESRDHEVEFNSRKEFFEEKKNNAKTD